MCDHGDVGTALFWLEFLGWLFGCVFRSLFFSPRSGERTISWTGKAVLRGFGFGGGRPIFFNAGVSHKMRNLSESVGVLEMGFSGILGL